MHEKSCFLSSCQYTHNVACRFSWPHNTLLCVLNIVVEMLHIIWWALSYLSNFVSTQKYSDKYICLDC